MVLLFSIHFSLMLSTVAGLVPFRYNFRRGRPESSWPMVALASVLSLVWVGLHNREGNITEHSRFPKVGMQDIIHAVENFILKGNCLLICVLQLLNLGPYRRLLGGLLTAARAWNGRRTLARARLGPVFVQLVLLPVVLYLLHTCVYMGLVGWSRHNVVHALLSMVTLVPSILHVNNFYAMLFVQRLTLGEINDQLADLWSVCVRNEAPGRPLPVVARLQRHLQEYQQCADTLRDILRFYCLPVALYLLILFQELMSKFFYQFTYFYTFMNLYGTGIELEIIGIVMIVIYGIETGQLIATCYGISEQSRDIKSSVHRLSLIPGQDRHFHGTVQTFLLSLNHSILHVNVAGLFNLDFELLTGMIGAISNFVVLLTQFHIDYSKHFMAFKGGNASSCRASAVNDFSLVNNTSPAR